MRLFRAGKRTSAAGKLQWLKRTAVTVNEHLLEAFLAGRRPIFTVYEPGCVEIVLGMGTRAEQDIFLERAGADGIPVLRRKGGGGTVLLSPGQVVLALVTEVGRPFNNLEYAHTINSWFKESLSDLGVVGIEERGITDLAIGDRKILGASLYRRRLVLFYQASLLVENDTSLFNRYLTYPTRAPDYRNGRDHVLFCTTLKQEGYAITVSQVIKNLEEAAGRNLPALI